MALVTHQSRLHSLICVIYTRVHTEFRERSAPNAPTWHYAAHHSVFLRQSRVNENIPPDQRPWACHRHTPIGIPKDMMDQYSPIQSHAHR